MLALFALSIPKAQWRATTQIICFSAAFFCCPLPQFTLTFTEKFTHATAIQQYHHSYKLHQTRRYAVLRQHSKLYFKKIQVYLIFPILLKGKYLVWSCRCCWNKVSGYSHQQAGRQFKRDDDNDNAIKPVDFHTHKKKSLKNSVIGTVAARREYY